MVYFSIYRCLCFFSTLGGNYVIEKYYLEKYPYSIACDSIKRLYANLPNVKSIENQNNREDTFTMSSYNGESRVYSLSPYGKRHSIAYGPESKEYYSKKRLISSAKGEAQSIREKLEQNKMVFFFVDKDLVNRANSYTIKTKAVKFMKFCNLILKTTKNLIA